MRSPSTALRESRLAKLRHAISQELFKPDTTVAAQAVPSSAPIIQPQFNMQKPVSTASTIYGIADAFDAEDIASLEMKQSASRRGSLSYVKWCGYHCFCRTPVFMGV
jgi:hypothetical protein